ncbi:uncharacterized protein LOC117803055 [Ailuropoda melanoleuca]|uniref:uncharacterized protein LOC117803055 n=1 Tax=Ailuropoda melanoleuca TaxID=9646 RepID=UPI0014942DC1|nr:uncharacterized protein LOC117803055 [Ailuropoda melanoleuca]
MGLLEKEWNGIMSTVQEADAPKFSLSGDRRDSLGSEQCSGSSESRFPPSVSQQYPSCPSWPRCWWDGACSLADSDRCPSIMGPGCPGKKPPRGPGTSRLRTEGSAVRPPCCPSPRPVSLSRGCSRDPELCVLHPGWRWHHGGLWRDEAVQVQGHPWRLRGASPPGEE